MKKTIISIIIPAYKVEDFVEKCIRSTMDQDLSREEYEVIVINDGSPDNTLNIAQKLSEEFTNLYVISKPNGGLSSARNAGMRVAKGEYYMFLDSDDWIASNCLAKLANKLCAEKPDCLAICAANVINGLPVRRKSYQDESPISGRNLLKKGVEPCAPFSLWKASFLREKNLFFYEGIFHEDSEFTPRAYYFAERVSFTNDIIYYVYQNPNSITRSVNAKKSFDLVNVVCKRLSEFAQDVSSEDRYIFYNLVALYLNNALANIIKSDLMQQTKFNDEVVRSRFLWRDMKKSTVLKYKIEAYLFELLPRNPLLVYKMLQKINFRR